MRRSPLIAATVLAVAACGETTTAPGADTFEAPILLGHASAPVTYEGTLVEGHGNTGTVPWSSVGESADWDYWSFSATAGQTIDIEVHRTTSGMDPVASLWTGLTTDALGLAFGGGGNADLVAVAHVDDNLAPPHSGVDGGLGEDVKISATATVSGIYTLTVADFLGGAFDGEVPYDILFTLSGGGGCSIESADTEELWPANHKMRTVLVTTLGGCSTLIVESDEDIGPEDWSVTDNGDGTFDVQLRAEWNGNGDGRTYTITATGATSSVEVTVPHSKGKG